MKTCKYCGHIELSKQEIEIYRRLSQFKTSREIADILKISRKTVLVILTRLRGYGLVLKNGKSGRSILFEKTATCSDCKHFEFLSAFNTCSCNKSKGLTWYCNEHKKIIRRG